MYSFFFLFLQGKSFITMKVDDTRKNERTRYITTNTLE